MGEGIWRGLPWFSLPLSLLRACVRRERAEARAGSQLPQESPFPSGHPLSVGALGGGRGGWGSSCQRERPGHPSPLCPQLSLRMLLPVPDPRSSAVWPSNQYFTHSSPSFPQYPRLPPHAICI